MTAAKAEPSPPEGLRLGVAQATDIPALVRLLDQLFAIESDFSADASRQERGLRSVLSSPTACVMVARSAAGTPVAMCSAQLVYSTAEGAPSAWIEDVIVDAAWRSRGLGRSVLQATLDWARSQGATRAQLMADLDNQPALDFYRRLGWATTRLGALRLQLVDRQ